MNSEARSMTGFEWLLLIVLSILWGGSFFFISIAVSFFPPFTIVALRLSIAAVFLLAVVYLGGSGLPGDRSIWLAFLGMGVLNNAIPFTLIVWGQTQIASGLASILNATTPFFTLIIPVIAIVLGCAVLGERLEIKHFVGMGLISLGLLAIDGRLFRLVQHRFCTRPAVLSAAEKES